MKLIRIVILIFPLYRTIVTQHENAVDPARPERSLKNDIEHPEEDNDEKEELEHHTWLQELETAEELESKANTAKEIAEQAVKDHSKDQQEKARKIISEVKEIATNMRTHLNEEDENGTVESMENRQEVLEKLKNVDKILEGAAQAADSVTERTETETETEETENPEDQPAVKPPQQQTQSETDEEEGEEGEHSVSNSNLYHVLWLPFIFCRL